MRRAPNGLPATARELPKIVYIGSTGRSGSTLVGRVLGEAPDAICVGETRYLWTRGLLHNVRCGCGEPFRSCTFWSAVGQRAFGGWPQLEPHAVAALDRLTVRLRSLPYHLFPTLRPSFAAAVSEYVSILTRLYGAIAEVSGARTIVDTSKEPNFALLLTRMDGYDVRIVHLVRDSRAVAYSWTREKPMPSPIGTQMNMPTFSPIDTATRWLVWNTAFRMLGARESRYLRISYESFVAEPRLTLQRLSAFADDPLALPASQLTANTVTLGAHHMFSGNPMRARVGDLEMRLDDEWQTKLPASQFAKVTAITWPQLRLYGYPVLPAVRRDLVSWRAR